MASPQVHLAQATRRLRRGRIPSRPHFRFYYGVRPHSTRPHSTPLKPSVAATRRGPPTTGDPPAAVTLSGGTRSRASAPAAMADIRTRGRRGCGLKGKRTKRMVEQLAKFTKWLHDNPINEHVPSRTVGARSNQFWLLNEKTFKRDAARTGRKRGFSSAKTLASAFRNSKA